MPACGAASLSCPSRRACYGLPEAGEAREAGAVEPHGEGQVRRDQNVDAQVELLAAHLTARAGIAGGFRTEPRFRGCARGWSETCAEEEGNAEQEMAGENGRSKGWRRIGG